MLFLDHEFDRFDIYAFKYETTQLNSTARIDECGKQLKELLIDPNRGLEKKNLIFVTHSMGGLVVRSMLLNSNDEFVKHVPLVAFYGTPTNGADLAKFAEAFSGNPQIEQLVKGNNWIRSQSLAWLSRDFKVRSIAAYETVPTNHVIVVDVESASALVQDATGISQNHVELVKPMSLQDIRHIVLRNAVAKYVPFDPCRKQAYPDDKVDDEFRKLGLSEEKVLRLGQKTIRRKPEAEVIWNISARDVDLLIFDCSSRYHAKPGDLGWACIRLKPNEWLRGSVLTEFRDPSGWFLIFRRSIDLNSGKLVDINLGVFDLFEGEPRQWMLVNDPDGADRIELKPYVQPAEN